MTVVYRLDDFDGRILTATDSTTGRVILDFTKPRSAADVKAAVARQDAANGVGPIRSRSALNAALGIQAPRLPRRPGAASAMRFDEPAMDAAMRQDAAAAGSPRSAALLRVHGMVRSAAELRARIGGAR